MLWPAGQHNLVLIHSPKKLNCSCSYLFLDSPSSKAHGGTSCHNPAYALPLLTLFYTLKCWCLLPYRSNALKCLVPLSLSLFQRPEVHDTSSLAEREAYHFDLKLCYEGQRTGSLSVAGWGLGNPCFARCSTPLSSIRQEQQSRACVVQVLVRGRLGPTTEHVPGKVARNRVSKKVMHYPDGIVACTGKGVRTSSCIDPWGEGALVEHGAA
eukprot:1140853-Pelagomonas_calceolata.AAC.10